VLFYRVESLNEEGSPREIVSIFLESKANSFNEPSHELAELIFIDCHFGDVIAHLLNQVMERVNVIY
jgi:hypothetical protein